MNRYFKAQVAGNISVNRQFKLLSIYPLSEIVIPQAGQFYMIQAGDTYDPLLKRPFSIFRQEDNTLQFLYRIRGKGTLYLSNVKKGDTLDLIGPLGNGYPVPKGDFIAVVGGIGIASLYALIEQHKNRAHAFYGARNKDELLMLNEVSKFSKKICITTDDGSAGKQGLITTPLKVFLRNNHLPIYTCGSMPMLKTIFNIIKDTELKCYASLEENMACGIGACLGCVVKARSESASGGSGVRSKDKKNLTAYKRICKEGPVFDLRDIVWE